MNEYTTSILNLVFVIVSLMKQVIAWITIERIFQIYQDPNMLPTEW